MSVKTIPEFLPLLERSSLVTREQLDAAREWRCARLKDLVNRLIREGSLTVWQAQQLLAGKGSRSQFFLGKYRLLELIGTGGMGSVYKAVQPGIARTVAIKKLNRQVLKQSRAVERFLREIRSAAAVDDPHVVRAYDADCDQDTYYLVMEYVPGKNLKHWIREQKTLPVAWSCECIRQAALGLQHAHELGLLHRDIKSSNLLVTQGEDGLPLVKILDLGLARFASETPEEGELTRSGQVLGTPDYMAPEQARDSKQADIRADIFSMGCTLFELLTGRFPFGGNAVMEKLLARATEDAIPVDTVRPDVPPGLSGVLARMLERDPNRRYATPAEVAQALAPYALATRLELPPHTAAPVADPPLPMSNPDFEALQAEIALSEADTPHSNALSRLTERERDRKSRIVRQSGVALVVVVLAGWLAWSLHRGSSEATGDGSRQASRLSPAADDDAGGPGTEAARREAAWVLQTGGSVEVALVRDIPQVAENAGAEGPPAPPLRSAARRADLPAEPFEIRNVQIRRGTELSDRDLEHLSAIASLRGLDLTGTQFPESSLGHLVHLESLERLDVAETAVSDAGVALLVRCPALQALDLGKTRITPAALQSLTGLKTLRELSLEGTRIGDKHLRTLQSMPQLTALSLAHSDVLGPGLVALRPLKNLLTLDLSGIPLRDRALRYLGVLESLEVLRLTRAKVSDEDLKHLSGLSRLREIVLASTPLTGEGLKHLGWMTRLELLDLQETVVGDAGLKQLRELSSLKRLYLRRTLVTDQGVAELLPLKDLQYVDLGETKVTPAGIEPLRTALPDCRVEY